MKFLIASDIHGSAFYTKKVLQAVERENADKLILLGDIFNHGPRNPLPLEYAPLEVAKLLNAIKDNLLVIKGNCDSQVDTMISEFDFIDSACLCTDDKTIYLTHGHIYNKDAMPKTKYDAIVYGHFHTGFIESKDGVIVANCGSVSLPKNNTASSYILLDGKNLILKDIDGNEIIKKEI